MSAITGIFNRDGLPVSSEQIEKMNVCLSHRGPDGSNVLLDGPVALGHQMLHTTPESIQEELPMEDTNSDLIITSDARIDNRFELAPLLGIENAINVPDSMFILKAYEKWGENCAEKLLGDFSFAIWDKEKETLFCARDCMGVKPFYYYLSENGFYFASEIKAILSIPEIPSKINELKAALHLMGVLDERKLTFYEGIFRLPSAHFIKLSFDKFEIERYWKLDPELSLHMDSDEKYVNKFRELFTEAVRCRLRTPFPIGFELSGGLDSSSIVCTAKRIFKNDFDGSRVSTFSHTFKEIPESDETEYIKEVVGSGSFKPYYLRSDKISPLDHIEEILKLQDEPYCNPNISLFWNLYKLMQENGVRVVFNGNDGDGVLSRGHNYFKELAFDFRFRDLIDEINGFSGIHSIHPLVVFFNKVLYPSIPGFFEDYVFKFMNRPKKRRMGEFVLSNKELSRKLDLESYYNECYWSNRPDKAKQYHYFILNLGAHQTTLEVLDRCTGACSMEPRYPFYDRRLLEFCYAIPTDQKFRLGWDRYILRKAMDNILPSKIQWRPRKKTFSPILEKNLLLFEEGRLDSMIYHDNQRIRKFVNMISLEDSYKRYKYKTQDYDPVNDPRNIEKFIMLNVWLEQNKKYIYDYKANV